MDAEELSKRAFPILSPLQSGTEDVVRLSDALEAAGRIEQLERELAAARETINSARCVVRLWERDEPTGVAIWRLRAKLAAAPAEPKEASNG